MTTSKLQFFTAPANQGQIVTYSYAVLMDSDGDAEIVERRHDASDDSTTYYLSTEYVSDEDAETLDLASAAPGGYEFEPMPMGQARKLGLITTPAVFTATLRDGGGSTHTVTGEDADDLRDGVQDEADEWVRDGSWGDDGASVDVWWTITDEDGDEIDTGSVTVEVEPDHDAMIRAAGGDTDCDHEWEATYEQEGGCKENPGVWSTGGTTISMSDHCVHCGLLRKRIFRGSQRNPGERDTTTYEMPEKVDAADAE